jgi:RNA recognition motif-containing protein
MNHGCTYQDKMRKISEKENSRKLTKSRDKPVKVSITNLHKNTTREDILSLLKDYQLDLSNHPFLITKVGGDLFVFATVYFINKSEAIKAKSNLDGTIQMGNRISIRING